MKRLNPPQNIEAEKGLIGSLIWKPESVLETIAQKRFRPEWIFTDIYRDIYHLIEGMVREKLPANPQTLTVEVSRKWPERAGEYAFAITDCYTFTPTAGNAPYYMETIQECAAKRMAMVECETMYHEFSNGATLQQVHDICTGAFAEVKEACAKPEVGNLDVEQLSQFMDKMQSVIDGTTKPNLLETSLPTLDEDFGGFAKGEVVVVLGLPSTGKSLFGQGIVQPNVFNHDKSAMIFTMEMPADQYLERIHSSIGHLSLKAMRNGRYTKAEFTAFSEAFSKINKVTENRRLCIRDLRANTMTPEHIESAIRRRHKDYGLDIVVIDHLHLIKFRKSKNESRRDQDLQAFTASMKRLAVELNILMIILAQSNQQGLVFDGSLTEADADFMFAMLPTFENVRGIKKITGTDGIYVQKARAARRGYKISVVMEGEYCTIRET